MKILILGVGNAQADVIRYCKARGYKVYGCSYTREDKNIYLLDHFEQINIIDKEEILKFSLKHQIDIVYSVGSDIAMPTVSYVSEIMKTPCFVSYNTASVCNMKHKMREKLGKDFGGNIEFRVLGRQEDFKEITFFPSVIKPVDSQGQRGVYLVNSQKDLENHFESSKSYSREGKVIVERYLNGSEVSVNAYMNNGEMIFAIVSDRISFHEYPGGIIKEHILPSVYSEDIQNEIIKLAFNAAQKLGILNGPAYFQIKLEKSKPYIIEATPRLDGCHMWRLIKFYTGVDLMEVCMNHLLTGITNMPEQQRKPGFFKLKFICQPPGTIVKPHYENALFSQSYYSAGDIVKRQNGYMEKCGYVIEKYDDIS